MKDRIRQQLGQELAIRRYIDQLRQGDLRGGAHLSRSAWRALPRIAITLGDPRGIGPEITAARARVGRSNAEVTLVGAEDQISASLPASRRVPVGTWGQGSGERTGGSRAARSGRGGSPGTPSRPRSKLALAGEVDAIVTAPAHKHALHLAGFPYPGHTEWLAHLAGDVDVAMMLAAEELRVVLVTTHVPFRDVPALLTQDRVIRTGRIDRARRSREWWGIDRSRGSRSARSIRTPAKSGLFGDEEARVLRPAAEALGADRPAAGGYGVRARDAGRVRRGARALSRRGDDGDQGGRVRAGGERDARAAVSADLTRSRDRARHRGARAGRMPSSMRAAIELAVGAGAAEARSRVIAERSEVIWSCPRLR